jgi:hypothetical protein
MGPLRLRGRSRLAAPRNGGKTASEREVLRESADSIGTGGRHHSVRACR